MEKIITERKDKRIYVDGDKCYKVFRAGYNKADILNEALNHARVDEYANTSPYQTIGESLNRER